MSAAKERSQRATSETGTGFAGREAVRGPFLPSLMLPFSG